MADFRFMNYNDTLRNLKQMRDTLSQAIEMIESMPQNAQNGHVVFADDLPAVAAPPVATRQHTGTRQTIESRLLRAEQGTLRERIRKYLSEHADRRFDIYTLAEALGVPHGGVSSTLSKLFRDGLVKKLAPGVFQGIPQ